MERNVPLKDRVAIEIRSRILDTRLAPGTRIDQGKLAVELNVSRMPVREALIALADEGLVDHIPHRGAYVARLTEEDVHDHFELYGLVAGLAAARAARNRTDEDITRLSSMLRELEAVERDPERIRELNVRFHRGVNRASQSRRISRTLEVVARAMPTEFFSRRAEYKSELDAQHRSILTAIEEGLPEEADRHVRDHLHTGANILVTYLREIGSIEGCQDDAGSQRRLPTARSAVMGTLACITC